MKSTTEWMRWITHVVVICVTCGVMTTSFTPVSIGWQCILLWLYQVNLTTLCYGLLNALMKIKQMFQMSLLNCYISSVWMLWIPRMEWETYLKVKNMNIFKFGFYSGDWVRRLPLINMQQLTGKWPSTFVELCFTLSYMYKHFLCTVAPLWKVSVKVVKYIQIYYMFQVHIDDVNSYMATCLVQFIAHIKSVIKSPQ